MEMFLWTPLNDRFSEDLRTEKLPWYFNFSKIYKKTFAPASFFAVNLYM